MNAQTNRNEVQGNKTNAEKEKKDKINVNKRTDVPDSPHAVSVHLIFLSK